MNEDDETPEQLPELTPERADAIEQRVFEDIGRSRAASARRRRTGWAIGGAAAAVVVVAAVISPVVVGALSRGTSLSAAMDSPVQGATLDRLPVQPVQPPDAAMQAEGVVPAPETAPGASGSAGSAPDASGTSGGAADAAAPGAAQPGRRDIVATASQALTVDDVAAAASAVTDAVEALGGYVESTSISADPASGADGTSTGATSGIAVMPYPYPAPGSRVQVRVPVDSLTTLMEQVADLGTVTDSSIDRRDVTDQTVDLRARIDSTQASVDALTALLARATSISDLISAENALADRQATLESYQQQLAMLEGQVAMSTLSVSLSPVAPVVRADPAGFGDGLVAGWNGLVAALNGIVIALGFLLPWIVALGVLALIAWGVVALVRSIRRRARRPAAAPGGPQHDESGD